MSNQLLAVPLGLQQLKGAFLFNCNQTCQIVERLNIVSNECTKTYSKKFAVSFDVCKKRYYGILQEDFRITETPCYFNDSNTHESFENCDNSLTKISSLYGFFNDIYDYMYLMYIGMLKSLIAGYYIIRHKCFPRPVNSSHSESVDLNSDTTNATSQPALNAPHASLALTGPQERLTLNAPHAPLALTGPQERLTLNAPHASLALTGPQERLTVNAPHAPLALTGPQERLTLYAPNALVGPQTHQTSLQIVQYEPIPQKNVIQELRRQAPITLHYQSIPSAPTNDIEALGYFNNSILTSTHLENSAQARRSTLTTTYHPSETISSMNKKKQTVCACSSVIGACKLNSNCSCVKNKRKCSNLCHKPNAKCMNVFCN